MDTTADEGAYSRLGRPKGVCAPGFARDMCSTQHASFAYGWFVMQYRSYPAVESGARHEVLL